MKMRTFDVAVIGAGPTGSYAAERLNALGYNTAIIEEHNEVGRPQQCAGLVNPTVFELPGLATMKEKVTLEVVKGADIYSPSGLLLPLRGKGPKALAIDRALFDKEVFISALRSGASPFIGQRADSLRRTGGHLWEIRTSGHHGALHIFSHIVLGCDGPNSMVRRYAGFARPKDIITGIAVSARTYTGSVPEGIVGVFTGQGTAKGFFAWAIPSGRKGDLRLGSSSIEPGGLVPGFERLLTDERLSSYLSTEDRKTPLINELSRTFGPIPMGCPRSIIGNGVVLLGDSAGMAKPTSGGGIFPALTSVNLLSSIVEQEGSIGELTLDRFQHEWSKGYGRELERAFIVRRILREIDDKEMDLVIRRLSRPDIIATINDEGDIDHPMALATSLLKKDPGLLGLVPRFLPYLRKVL